MLSLILYHIYVQVVAIVVLDISAYWCTKHYIFKQVEINVYNICIYM